MALANIREGYKTLAWFNANPTLVLLQGQRVNLDTQLGVYKLGDGVTQLSVLTWLGDISGKENTSNKQNSLSVDGTGVKYPTVDAVNAAKQGIQKGLVFSDHFQRASLGANYTKVGAQSCAITGNELVISGGASSGTFAEVLKHTGYGNTNINQFTTKIFLKVGSLAGFLGVGISSNFTAGQKYGVYAGMFQNTGQLAIYQLNATTPGTLVTSATNLTFSLNDIVCVELTRNRYSYSASVYNVTTNSAVITASYTPSTYTLNFLANTGNFALLTYAGTQTLSSWVTTTTDKYNADMCFIGDSITEIFSVNSYDNNYTEQVAKKSGNSVIKFARTNAVTQDILNSLPEIIAFNPKRVYIMVGGNDINFSIATGTWQANLTTIWNTLTSAGIPFTNLLATPRNNGTGIYAIIPVNTYMIASGHPYIDTYTPLATGITANPKYFHADLVHPNDNGHDFIASIILNQL